MNYWLLKTEPETYSWENLEQQKVADWDGVRNYQARNFLRNMKMGDWAFIYHSGKQRQIVGIAEIVKEHFPDTTANKGEWVAVKVKPIRKLKRSLSLDELKKINALNDMILFRNSRLSVQPIDQKHFSEILELE